MNFNNYSTKSEKTTFTQTVGSVKRTLGRITVKVDYEDAYKSKIELWLQWGRKLADKPINVNYGVPRISVDESVDGITNLGKWGEKVEKEERRLSVIVNRILECYPDVDVRKTAESIVQDSYTISCRTELAEPENFTGKKYEIDYEGTPVFFADTDPFQDNGEDIELTAKDIQSKLYNFTTTVFTKLGEFIDAHGTCEGFMFNSWSQVKDNKQYLNSVTYPEALILPTKSKTNGQLYYNVDNWDAQWIFQASEHLTENEEGVIQGLIESPTDWQKKFALNMKSVAEINAELEEGMSEDIVRGGFGGDGIKPNDTPKDENNSDLPF